MITDYKGHKISNCINVFNFYKRFTGNSIEKDIAKLSVLNNIKEENILEGLADNGIEITEILDCIQAIYYSMRCAAEREELDPVEIVNEIAIDDLISGEITQCINFLLSSKKKEPMKAPKKYR